MSREYAELVRSFEAKRIVCPLPIPWNQLVIFLKSTKRLKMYPVEKGPSVEVANPLILAGWGASDTQRSSRLINHPREADKLGILPTVKEFLDKLQPKDFLCARRELSDISVWDLEAEGGAEVDRIMAGALPAV